MQQLPERLPFLGRGLEQAGDMAPGEYQAVARRNRIAILDPDGQVIGAANALVGQGAEATNLIRIVWHWLKLYFYETRNSPNFSPTGHNTLEKI